MNGIIRKGLTGLTAACFLFPYSQPQAFSGNNIKTEEVNSSSSNSTDSLKYSKENLLGERIKKIVEDPIYKRTISLLNDNKDKIYVSAAKALNIIAIQGGYISLKQEKSVDTDENLSDDRDDKFKLPLYCYYGEYLMPELDHMAKEISSFVNKEVLESVVKELKKDEGDVNIKSIETISEIREGKLVFSYDIFFRVKSDDTYFVAKTPELEIESKLYEMYKIARFIAEPEEENPDDPETSNLEERLRKRGLVAESLDVKVERPIDETEDTDDYILENYFLYKISLKDNLSQLNVGVNIPESISYREAFKILTEEDARKIDNSMNPYSFYFLSKNPSEFVNSRNSISITNVENFKTIESQEQTLSSLEAINSLGQSSEEVPEEVSEDASENIEEP